MKTLQTNQFILEQINGNVFKVYRRNYVPLVTVEYGEIYLNDEAVAGLEKKPTSGFWADVVKQCVEQNGKLYEKYGK